MQSHTKAKKIKTAVWLVLGLAMLVYYIISGIFAGCSASGRSAALSVSSRRR